MTITPVIPARPHSALELLLGPGGDVTVSIPAEARENLGLALENLPAAARDAAAAKVREAAAGVLDIDLIEVLISGWRHYHDLVSAARRTLATPASSELVSLVTHRVTATQEPSVSVLVNDHVVAVIRFTVSVVFDVSALTAGIRAGLLTEVHTGRCDITATLAIDGYEVTSRRARLELPGAIPLAQGIRLLAAQDYPLRDPPVSASA